MADRRIPKKESILEAGVEDMRLENGNGDTKPGGLRTGEIKDESGESRGSTPRDSKTKSASQSPIKRESSTQSPTDPMAKHEEVVGGDITLKMEPGQPPKLSRSSSHKVIAGPAQLYHNNPDKTEEAQSTFQVLPSCVYSSKYIGSAEHESYDCDCVEDFGESSVNTLSLYLSLDTEPAM